MLLSLWIFYVDGLSTILLNLYILFSFGVSLNGFMKKNNLFVGFMINKFKKILQLLFSYNFETFSKTFNF